MGPLECLAVADAPGTLNCITSRQGLLTLVTLGSEDQDFGRGNHIIDQNPHFYQNQGEAASSETFSSII